MVTGSVILCKNKAKHIPVIHLEREEHILHQLSQLPVEWQFMNKLMTHKPVVTQTPVITLHSLSSWKIKGKPWPSLQAQ